MKIPTLIATFIVAALSLGSLAAEPYSGTATAWFDGDQLELAISPLSDIIYGQISLRKPLTARLYLTDQTCQQVINQGVGGLQPVATLKGFTRFTFAKAQLKATALLVDAKSSRCEVLSFRASGRSQSSN